jgi:hypothetical protein
LVSRDDFVRILSDCKMVNSNLAFNRVEIEALAEKHEERPGKINYSAFISGYAPSEDLTKSAKMAQDVFRTIAKVVKA